jgi:fatty-acyl-CoA synthase
MNTTHHVHWPAGLPHTISTPDTSVYVNLEISARRYPNRPAIIFYDTVLSYAQVHADVLALAGYLQQVCGVRRGDRVLLNMQNSPQFIIGYYAIMRADAVAVPVNPMLMSDELKHYVDDSGATVAIVAQEVFPRTAPLVGKSTLTHAIVATYADYLTTPTELKVPDFVHAPRDVPEMPDVIGWKDAIAEQHGTRPHLAGPDDLACMPYTSGTTGKP